MEGMRYFKACLGGLLGGVVAALPWLILYMFGGYIVSILAFLIALGVNYGYRKFKGRVNRKLPMIIIIISVFILILIDLVIVPIYFLISSKIAVSFESIINLILSEFYWKTMLRELAISTVFVAAGIFKTVNDIKHEIGLYY